MATSCTSDLDRFPSNDSTDKEVYNTFDGYKEALAKVYGGYTLTGNSGPAGSGDISGLDEGSYADFIRGFFNAQELPTDEVMCIWSDDGISGLNYINFSSSNPFTRGLYSRSMTHIMYANSFIQNSADGIVNGKGFSATEVQEIGYFNAEARFLRAFQYWVLMDLYGNPPFVDENSPLDDMPEQIKRADLFAYIESELLEIKDLLQEPRQNEYGRADKAAAWALLARLYLNAAVYTGTAKYTEAATYSKMVIDAGYTLKPNYEDLFLADNNLNNNEIILSINYDGTYTRNYGGTSFLINSSFTAKLETDHGLSYGLSGAWGGNRTRGKFSEKFDAADGRKLLAGDTPVITDVTDFYHGLASYKFRNITSAGVGGTNTNFADTDFPLFRLAEMYLIYAEAVKRGGTGSDANALTYMNLLRVRAFGNSTENYGSFAAVTLDEILDERARELYWECHRRTDLVRYGYFTTARYMWEWKGGTKEGRSVSSHYNIYPIPSTDITANPNLKQNPNY
ncbi:RagB/SusD family nutrient uptake outer membrane protein [Dysgonomonas sp. 25]|nr:RagB/SusD family nutrient uptake outer membrane protein [Dysgonomonas sp. 25]